MADDAPSVDDGPLRSGQRIGQSWVVLAQIGRGGMSVVYRGQHERLHKVVAIKVLRQEMRQHPGARHRFLNEARAADRVRHPGVVRIHDFGTADDGTDYIIMEHLQGRSLDQRPAGPRVSREDLELFAGVAEAMAAVHAQGIVHRDLKPQNLVVLDDGGPPLAKVVDFGIAKLPDGAPDSPEASDPTLETGAGQTLGTPRYKAPEQYGAAQRATDRADVYALGGVMYERFAGRPVFQGTEADLMMQHIHAEPPPLAELAPGVPRELCRLIHAMLVKDPAGRPGMEQVAQALAGMAARKPRWPRLLWAALGVPAGLLLLWMLRPGAGKHLEAPDAGSSAASASSGAPFVDGGMRRAAPAPESVSAAAPRADLSPVPAGASAAGGSAHRHPAVPTEVRLITDPPVEAQVIGVGRITPGQALVVKVVGRRVVKVRSRGYIDETVTIDPANGPELRIHLEPVPP